MAEFVLDTSGTVDQPAPQRPGAYLEWQDLSPFCQGYVEAMFADGVRLADGAMLSRVPLGFSDLSPAALELILKDCAAYSDQTSLRSKPDGERWWKARVAAYPQALPVFREDLMRRYPPLRPVLSDEGKVDLVPSP